MPKRPVCAHAVNVSPTFSFVREVASLFQLADDALHGSLSDTDARGQISDPQMRIFGHADQHVRVVGQERPRWRFDLGTLELLLFSASHALTLLKYDPQIVYPHARINIRDLARMPSV
jgi:hypothetical protein